MDEWSEKLAGRMLFMIVFTVCALVLMMPFSDYFCSIR